MQKILKIYFLLCLSFFCGTAQAERLKDLADIAGVRSNQLIGYGLVVGLDGTGDQTSQAGFTLQSFKTMLSQFGIQVPAGMSIQLKNVAAVAVQAELPAFAKPGQSIDVTVSSIGNAKSLRGGSLLLTPLRGADGQVYAMSQGNLVVGGLGVQGNDGSRISINIPSAGRIPNGATVERMVQNPFGDGDSIVFNLKAADFTTARRLADAINDFIGSQTARPLDAASIRVSAPRDPSQRVMYVSVLENLEVKPAEAVARVIVNSRTGTIVIGQHVTLSPAAITHGSLTVTIKEDQRVSQPEPFSEGETVVVPDTEIAVAQQDSKMFLFEPGASLSDLVAAVNRVGASPGDLMAILEALKQAGSLKADLVVI